MCLLYCKARNPVTQHAYAANQHITCHMKESCICGMLWDFSLREFARCMNCNMLRFIFLHCILQSAANQKLDIRNHAHSIIICTIFLGRIFTFIFFTFIPRYACRIMRIRIPIFGLYAIQLYLQCLQASWTDQEEKRRHDVCGGQERKWQESKEASRGQRSLQGRWP